MISPKDKVEITMKLYLNCKYRQNTKFNSFTDEQIKDMKWLFAKMYSDIINERGSKIIVGDKERSVLAYIFDWMICSASFSGDVKKGLYLMCGQGFGKDVFLKAITNFFEYFGKYFKDYTFHNFNIDWYEKGQVFFNMPIKINDISEKGRVKRERESIPFLEFLDYREQINNRRGIIVSSNFGAKKLQDTLEFDSTNPRLLERIKEVFNIVVIEDVESKRIENKITIK